MCCFKILRLSSFSYPSVKKTTIIIEEWPKVSKGIQRLCQGSELADDVPAAAASFLSLLAPPYPLHQALPMQPGALGRDSSHTAGRAAGHFFNILWRLVMMRTVDVADNSHWLLGTGWLVLG